MRLGLYGGTFDPIHLGHLLLAESCREACGLDTVWFVVAGVPPHKRGERTPVEHRLEMARIAVAGNAAFEVSEVEAHSPGPHYSYATLEAIGRERPGDELFFLIGADSLVDLPGWKNPERIVAAASLVVVNRPGIDAVASPELQELLDRSPDARPVKFVSMPPIGIASTDLRRRVAAGRGVRYRVPRGSRPTSRRRGSIARRRKRVAVPPGRRRLRDGAGRGVRPARGGRSSMTTDYDRIEAAIRYLDERARDQPDLDDLAGHLGLSPAHLQRMFRRWAGISPKRFVQFLTAGNAKGLLEESRSVLEATYASGLSGPGRLHDLIVAVDAVTPGQYKAGGAGLTIDFGLHPSPFGGCLLATTERGVCHLAFLDAEGRDEALRDLANRWPGAVLRERPDATAPVLERIFPADGPGGERSISLFLKGTNFQLKVWEALLRIPPGCVASYEDVARQVCTERAARAVGAAVGANPVAYLVPCHRVIRGTGAFSNYRWGPDRKRAMLAREAARRPDDATATPTG